MTTCIALLRGINVGRAKRIAMADLRALVEGLGHENVRTLLNSGNVVFEAKRPVASRIAGAIDAALRRDHGFSSAVVVVTAAELRRIIEANPLLGVATDHSRHLVAFVSPRSALVRAKVLLERSWEPEALALGPDAAYLWCAAGIIESRLMQEFARLTKDAATARNWATVLKLQALVDA